MDRLRYLLGILTLLAMATGGWFLFQQLEASDLADRYRIQVTFLDARGLKSGADVKFRGIRVGTAREVQVEPDGAHAVVLVTIDPAHTELVRTNSRFWIVTPRFHGLSSGVSGLETLVRDSFVAFSTPEPYGEPLESGSRLVGEEAPQTPRKDISLPPIERGDLMMRVLLPENFGVTVGARVMFRGMATGEVRSLALAPSGTHVEVKVRIFSRFRTTVTDASVFWVAKPEVSMRFSLSNPLSVNDLGSLLSPYLAYYTPPKKGVPVHDNYPVAASLKRPDIEVSEVPEAALRAGPTRPLPTPSGPLTLVRVVYEAIDVDWLSPNDTLHREGTGILYVAKDGREVVLTSRSTCDAAFFYRETFGEKAAIKNEKFAVQIPSGNVLKATRIWIEPSGVDMAVLLVEGLPRQHPTTDPKIVTFVADKDLGKDLQLHVAGERGVPEAAAALQLGSVVLDKARGGAVTQASKLVGFVAQSSEDDLKPKVVTLATLPASLRPKQ